jgi:hypothetical protein
MKFRLALAALLLAVLPVAASAMCTGDGHKMSTSVCGEGQTWDSDAQACVDTTA